MTNINLWEHFGRNILVVLTFLQLCGILVGLGIGAGIGKRALEDIAVLKSDINEIRENDIRLALIEEKVNLRDQKVRSLENLLSSDYPRTEVVQREQANILKNVQAIETRIELLEQRQNQLRSDRIKRNGDH